MQEIQPRFVGSCAILVGEAEVTPAASHVFALLVAFILAPREPWTRRQLQDLLFPGAEDSLAAHRLRQLVYRLRVHGVALAESADGTLRLMNPVGDLLAGSCQTSGPTGQPEAVRVLGLYAPRVSAPFADWLEQRRDALQAALDARLLANLRAARDRQDWSACVRLAGNLAAASGWTEDAVVIAAESYAMLSQRDAAVAVIDDFVRDGGAALESHPALKRLRGRVLSTRIPRREGTLRGREECLAFLTEQWERASGEGGGGRGCAILGAPGMGKSRAGEAFAASVRLTGGQVLRHRCDGQSRAFPLSLFEDLVPELRGRRGSIGADPDLATVLDRLVPGTPTDAPSPASVDETRDAVRRAILDLVEAVSEEQPILLLVDDAHLLDDASRAVLRSLVERANTARILVVLLCRPRPDIDTLLSSSPRFASYSLSPLSDADSRTLLIELSANRPLTPPELEWAVAEAGGNAFYLHALAHHPCKAGTLPAHVRSLAQTSYLGTSTGARTILDAALMLDTLATPSRVANVCGIETNALLGAARELEESDLLRYEDGLFAGPHAIIREVLDDLMPSTSRALLHKRIAELLAAECADPARARVVAWTAIQSWLACGEPVAAVALALQVARDAEAVGEPEAGAALLDRIPRGSLSLPMQRDVLDHVMRLADAGKCVDLLKRAIDERATISLQLGEGATVRAELTLSSARLDHVAGIRLDMTPMLTIIKDESVTAHVRLDALSRILGEADLGFDRETAVRVYDEARTSISETAAWESPAALRARILFHTVFGSVERALSLVIDIQNRFPAPSMDTETRLSRNYAAYALLRLGRYAECAAIAAADRIFTRDCNHLLASEYAGGMAIEAYVNLGAFEDARKILTEIYGDISRRAPAVPLHTVGVVSGEIAISLLDRDFDGAERLLMAARRVYPALSTPRLRTAFLAQQLRLAQLRGNAAAYELERTELTALVARGRGLGGLDSAVEVLWHYHAASGRADEATRLLRDYLPSRRELGLPEAILRSSTSEDPVWVDPGFQVGLRRFASSDNIGH